MTVRLLAMLTVFVILTAVDAVSIRSVLKSKVRSARQPTDTSIQVATSTAFKDGVKIRVTVGNKLDANEKKRDPVCNDGTQSPTSAQVDPDQGELQIIFEELDVSLCTSGLITADYCATDPLTDRPILGYIGLCPDAYMKSVETLKTLFRRAIGRILGFNKKAFAFLRDETGEPRTSRDPSTNRPNNGQDAFGIYTPSSSYLFYKTMSGATVVGRVENSYLFLALPTLVEYARKYFAYPQLEGIPLEDEGGLDVVEQYFDSRFVSHDVMTSGTDTVTGITGFTLAYMYDSGWYEISDAHEFAGTWGKGKGEDFFNKSCFEYTTVRKS
ncbi:Leishmanolysin-like peptidase, partial [Clonorchis sinensis]